MTLDIRNDSYEFIGHVTNADDQFEIKKLNNGESMTIEVAVKNICFGNARDYFGLELAPAFSARK